MESVLLSLIVIFIAAPIFRWSCKFRRTRGNQENHSEGEVSSSPLLSSASSLREAGGFEHDVFLSFRGADTRKGFTGHLHQALKEKGVMTFIDSEKLEKGQKVEELFGHIERSKIFVPIFSKGYANSQWCLKEIAKMVECRRLIIPVFFDVKPKDVRHQTGPFSSAFKSYSKKGKVEKEEVSKWGDALGEAGKIAGYNLADTEGHEAKLIQLIVTRVLTEVNRTPLFIARHPVGLNSRIADLMEVLDIEAQDDVRMVGIRGMGGIGKTTLAKAVYNQISSCFDACSFLSNVREAAEQSSGLISLQKQLLHDVFNDENVKVSDTSDGIGIIKQRIWSKKVLLVLDDVSDESQLKALACERDWFCAGSRIIVTTRDKRVLRAPRMKQNEVYELKVLDATQSLQLFCWHAFGKEEADEKFEELSKGVASTAAGLPLALEIFGSHFFDLKTAKQWRVMLERLKEDQDKDIHERLKISYDALEEKVKKVFLDIACFFVGERTKLPTLMWEACRFYPDITIKVLMHKSLVSINDETNEFEMHDHVRDMGRKIVEDERLSNPGMCSSRLWKDDETLDVLQSKRGTKNIEAIRLQKYDDFLFLAMPDLTSALGLLDDMESSMESICPETGNVEDICPQQCEDLSLPMLDPASALGHLRTECFEAMSQLRLLHLGNVTFEGGYEHFPRTLRWLIWSPRDLESLPETLHLENIVVLDLSWSYITQLWGQQAPRGIKMKQLNLLSLENCDSLKEVPECICSLLNLEELYAQGCSSLASFLNSLGNLRRLRKLDLSDTDIEELSDSIVLLEKLELLSVSRCRRLKFLPASASVGSMLLKSDGVSSASGDIANFRQSSVGDPSNRQDYSLLQFPSSLTELYATGCYELEMVADVSNAERLRELNLSGCQKLVDVPGVERLKWLNSLKLGGCRSISDSLRKRVEDANFERLTDFSISGILNAAESSDAPRLLAFSFLPKWFKSGSLYLKLGETGLDSVLGSIVIGRFTTADGYELLFEASFQAKVWRRFDISGGVPIVKLGEYGKMMRNGGGFVGNDGLSRSMMVMHVVIDGCLLLGGYLRSTTSDDACGDIAFDPCDITSIAHIRENFGGPLHYYEGPATVLCIDFS
ncbi:disease resistance protein Roq1-like isoform X2 [Nymphaea colorata]|uniref:disease resistance protein Roq1-like isoform X2 n=1 Tax=Nymphaea colorata TaxID=210225 RepID=UPI00129D27A5|nr:disease resistance protein Roq1-like isoform X2 [Nymphaea colorata]